MTGATPSQTVGPFFSIGLSARDASEAARTGSRTVCVRGRVLDGAGDPVPDALVEIWSAEGWARSLASAKGEFSLVTRKPAGLGGQAPHLAVMVFARGLLRQVLTRMYFPDETEANAADPVLVGLEQASRSTLVAAQDGDQLRFDIRLQGDAQTVFFAL